MSTASIDIETNMAHDTIWLGWVHYWESGEAMEFRTRDELWELLFGRVDTIAHWHGIGFELPVIKRVWGLDLASSFIGAGVALKQIDGLLLSRLYDPSRAGGHSLATYGRQLGNLKGTFTDFDCPPPGEDWNDWLTRMSVYCRQDAILNTDACKWLISKLKAEKFSQESIDLEHDVQPILVQQMANGFKLDVPYANKLYRVLGKMADRIERRLHSRFPPIITERSSYKTGKRLKDRVEVFNIGSRPQIARRLESLGAKFPRLPIPPSHAKRGVTIGAAKVDETTLAANNHIPEAAMCERFLLLGMRTSQINSWLEHVQKDDRVHGRIIGNACVTSRMSHSKPNMGQVTGCDKLYGPQMRRCWIVEKGNRLVGIDASGIELRLLAHYMKDEGYIHEILEGDVHTVNMKALGIDSRYDAKTWFYAWLYGAGNEKLGKIIGVSTREAGKKKNQFLDNTPALKSLKDLISDIAQTAKSVPSLDGRRIRVRHQHAALNSLLQGAGAIVMKKALVIFQGLLDDANIEVQFVANVHDEWQLECPLYIADAVGVLGVQAIVKAGECYRLRCALDGEYKVGKTWAETH